MPWKNEAQRRACYAKKREAESKGKKPKWDCAKWDAHSRFCGAKCSDGHKCQRPVEKGRCWQH